MAADQRKRRFNGTNIVGGGSQEKSRATKKHLGSAQSRLNMSPHISLEWNENQKQAVARKDQICISRRALAPFDLLNDLPRDILADVCAVPGEIFELDNLADVLSYEVWHSSLSSTEMNLLMQFLPKGLEVEEVLRSLLSGGNLHFGNPFIKWSSSLCSGNLHPDVVLQTEKTRNANKRAYYSELQKYHDDLVGELQSTKETWESCMDPEKDFVQNIWRSRKHHVNHLSSHNGYPIMNPEESIGATSESCSEATDEKACSSDNQISSSKRREFSNRRYMVESSKGAVVASDDMLKTISRPSKVNRLNKCIIRNSDGAQYMSYVKITKKQFELLKFMKQNGKSIQSRSLNRILGDLDSFQVRPYEAFEEEELTNLHKHWLQVAKRDLPSAFANWRRLQSQKCQITNSLKQELKEKLKSLIEDQETEQAGSGLLVEKNGEKAYPLSNTEEDIHPVSASANSEEPVEKIVSHNVCSEVKTMDVDLHANNVSDEEQSPSPGLLDYAEHLNRKDTVVNHEFYETSPDLREYKENLNRNVAVNLGIPVSSSPHLRVYTESLNRKDIALNQGIHVSLSPDLREYTKNLNRKDIVVNHGFPLCSPDFREYTESLERKDIAVNHAIHVSSSPDLREYTDSLNCKDNIAVNHGIPVCSLPDFRVSAENLNRKDVPVSHGIPVTQNLREFGHNLNQREITVNHTVPVSSSEYMWSSLPHTLYDSSPLQEYTSSNGLSLGHPQILAENPAGLIDLESNLPEQGSGGVNMLHIHSSNDNRLISFNNQRRSQPFQPFYPGQDNTAYSHEQKQTGLGLQQAGDIFLGNNQLPLQLEQTLKRPRDSYHLPTNIQDANIFSDGGRYYVPRDWTAVSNVSTPAMQSSHSNGADSSSQNWFSNQPRGGGNWSSLETTCFPVSSIGNGSINDESLFSVLSHFKELNPHHTSFDRNPTGSTQQQFTAPRNFSAMNGIVSRNTNAIPETVNSLNYMSRREPSTTQATNNVGWVNLPPQNPTLHELTGRPFLRSWNQ